MIQEDDLISQLIVLYSEMDSAYRDAASQGGFGCQGCDGASCCTVDLRIHTYTEMAYLIRGLDELPLGLAREVKERARQMVLAKARSHHDSEYRNAVCALNFKGLCTMYEHRPMICRLAGIPYIATRPDTTNIRGSGCRRFEEEVAPSNPDLVLDRSYFYKRMSEIELGVVKFRGCKTPVYTIAEIINNWIYSCGSIK